MIYARELYNLIEEKQFKNGQSARIDIFCFKNNYTNGQHTHEKMLTDHQRMQIKTTMSHLLGWLLSKK